MYIRFVLWSDIQNECVLYFHICVVLFGTVAGNFRGQVMPVT